MNNNNNNNKKPGVYWLQGSKVPLDLWVSVFVMIDAIMDSI